MINRWMGDIALLIQAKSGVTSAVIAWSTVVVTALLMVVAFLCVAGYDWLSLQLGAVFAGSDTAGAFLVIALIGAICARGVTPPRKTACDACTSRTIRRG